MGRTIGRRVLRYAIVIGWVSGGVSQIAGAAELAPATAEDILSALGQDARGLHLTRDSLPDLFTLTASRIEQDASKFIVEQPYTAGRWKGGKAVIEYARDLSYTLVSVYDKDGKRQHIYSVRTQFSMERERAASPPPRVPRPAAQESIPEVARVPEEETPRPPLRRTRVTVAAPEPAAVSAAPTPRVTPKSSKPARTQGQVNYQWSEKQAAYVPVKTAKPAKVKVSNVTWVERPATTIPEETAPPPRRKWGEGKTAAAGRGAPSLPSTRSVVRAKETPRVEPAVEDKVPTQDELLAQAVGSEAVSQPEGPDTTGSDSWVPTATSNPAEPEEEPVVQPVQKRQLAMMPVSAPVDNSVDRLLKMADQKGKATSEEGDSWMPKQVSAPKPDVEFNQELARIREQEKKKSAPTKVMSIQQDINNPEEGVMPVSSFEKSSGSMFGRHREYERRFSPGHKRQSKAPDHDFYVDEVDRKKEIHNIYFYKQTKGKAPRLVAVERHEKISFMGNYDIDKEDVGKITVYN
jgi:hypothetical protein